MTVTDKGGLSATAAVSILPGAIRRGDGNNDGVIDISDAVRTLLHLFGGTPTECALALDINANGSLEVTDAIDLLRYLFQEGPAPAAPFPNCGVARNLSAIPCATGCP